jgi:tripartite-type tricarboxylate transporter receptor subunit TctC
MRLRLCAAGIALVSFLVPAATLAQDKGRSAYPTKPVRVVVGYAPGGGADIMGRLISQKITESLGQQVIVDNKPGAGQNIGAEFVAKSPPDGYTLFMSSSALGINVSLYPKLGYDPVKSFVPVAVFAQSPNLLLVHPSLPASNAKEFIAFAKKNPGKLNFSSSGSGSTQHLSGELFKLMTGVEMTHVPYKGSAPSLTALVSGEVDFAFNNIPSAQPFLSSKRLKAIAITSRERSPLLPQVPTLIEAGLKGFDVAAWYGLLAPAGTPPEIVAKLHDTVANAGRTKEFRAQLAKMGADPIDQSSKFFEDFLKEEIVRWQKVIQASKAKPE